MPDRSGRPFHRARLRYDPAFAAELEYCYEKGLPHSYLLGGPLVFDDDDRDKLRAFMLERGERCNLCGTADWEWEADRFAYEPVVEVCHGCRMKDMMRDEATQPGSSVVLVTKERAQQLHANAKNRQIPRRARRE